MKKIISIICLSSLLCYNYAPNVNHQIQAEQKDTNDILYKLNTNVQDGLMQVLQTNQVNTILNNKQNEKSLNKILVYLGTLLVGYVIDSVFIYATGHSPGELVASVISEIEHFANRNNPNYLASITTNGTHVTGYSTLGGQECYRPNPNVNWVCKYSL